VDVRTTRDLDAVITGLPFTEHEIVTMFKRIAAIELDDDVEILYQRVTPIHEDGEYGGFRVSAEARFFTIRQPLKFDFSTGEIITPREIQAELMPLFGNSPFTVMAYTVETILAEKLHSIFSRGIDNTRLRDYYDVYVLSKTKSVRIDFVLLSTALHNTFANRNTPELSADYQTALVSFLSDANLNRLWLNYSAKNSFIGTLSFREVIQGINVLLGNVHLKEMRNGHQED
jgi:hypothetical protein